MTIQFSNDQKDKIKRSIATLGLKDPTAQENFINFIAEHKKLPIFGYGSLPTYSHLEDSQKKLQMDTDELKTRFPNLNIEEMQKGFRSAEGAYAQGKVGIVCADFAYRGQKGPEGEKSQWGLTAGLENIEGAKTSGAVLEVPLENMDPEEATDFILYNLEMLEKREFPLDMPIYKVDFQEVEMTDGSKSMAMLCMADKDSPLYRGHLSVGERAKILANALGPTQVELRGGSIMERGVGDRTGLDYLGQMIANSYQRDLSIDGDLYELYIEAVKARADLEPEIREELEYWDAIDHNALMMELNTRLERYNFSSMPESNGSLTGSFAIVKSAENDNSSINLSTPAIVETLSADVTDPDGLILTAA